MNERKEPTMSFEKLNIPHIKTVFYGLIGLPIVLFIIFFFTGKFKSWFIAEEEEEKPPSDFAKDVMRQIRNNPTCPVRHCIVSG